MKCSHCGNNRLDPHEHAYDALAMVKHELQFLHNLNILPRTKEAITQIQYLCWKELRELDDLVDCP